MNSGEIILNRDIFRILASTKRIAILKNLAQKKMTISELSRDLHIAKSTVHEHLALMTDVGLVIPGPDDHRWKYYEITPKGSLLLEPDISMRFVLILSSSGFVIIAGSVAAFVVDSILQVSAVSSFPFQGSGNTLMYTGIGMILLFIGLVILVQTFRIRAVFNLIEKKPV
ncbi:MAG: winged helix-turn-helix domain-containing protein [Methanoregula sp.]|nr:winged helix-turn-helix domain-containing protein [Methanoregula sp.]